MRMLMKSLMVATCLAFVGSSVADEHADAFVGTWRLNVARSIYKPGPPPKSLTRTYTKTANGLSLQYKSVQPDGKEITGSKVLKFDGKDYPADAPDYDTESTTKVDAFRLRIIERRRGREVGTITLVVSRDRQVMTLNAKGIDASGSAFEKVAVYDRE